MKKILCAAVVMAAFSGSVMAADVIRMGTEGAYPPYNFINDNGEVDGMERELGDELCRRAMLTCEWVTNDWDSIIPNLVSGNYDTIIAGMSVTDEREKVIDFTQAYIPPEPSAYLAMDASLEVGESVIIAAQATTIQAAFVAEQGWNLVEFATPEETIAAVRNNEADAVLASVSFLADYAVDGLVMLDRRDSIGGGIGMGLRESDDALRGKFNKAIESMKADGSLNKLIVKWKVGDTW